MKHTTPLYYALALHLVPGIGDVLSRQLLRCLGSAESVMKAPIHQLLQVPGIGLKTAHAIHQFNDYARVEHELRFLERSGTQCIHIEDVEYPQRLRHVSDAPCILFKRGNATLNPGKTVGIVGTRNASEYGKDFTEKLCAELQNQGCTIISGLALGIDGIAHRAALRNQLPTVGVLAHGLDRVYPSQHARLAKHMEDHGALISEFPSGTAPDRENFPKRNRIVAALCDVLVVVETAERGGARITAELAHSYNREVLALPGRIHDVYSQGCNTLIRTHKAGMITQTLDLIECMNWDQTPSIHSIPKQLNLELDSSESLIIQLLQTKKRMAFDELQIQSDLDSSVLSLKLLDLEFRNMIKALPGKYYMRRSS